MIKKNIIIRTQFIALHNWASCTEKEVGYLSFPHRHTFFIEIKILINDLDRELEFIKCKDIINNYINTRLLKDIPPYTCRSIEGKSCEQIAHELLINIDLPIKYVCVFEDNENGAELYYD